MNNLIRFGVSMENDLLQEFDKLLERKGYTTRSEAIRDLVREKLVEESVELDNSFVFGALVYIYNHHKRELEKSITELQHEYFDNIISTTHVHVDHDHCLEVILLKGKVKVLKSVSDKILSFKGVEHGKLTLTTSLVAKDRGSQKIHRH